MNKNIYLTPEQYDEMIQKKERILTIELPRNAEEISIAVAQGDLSENAEYENAIDEQAFLNKQLAEIENKLKYAKILEKSTKNDFVEVGHKVTIRPALEKQEETITLLSYGNGKDTISIESPLGKALLGKAVGEDVIVTAPVGKLTYTILEIN